MRWWSIEIGQNAACEDLDDFKDFAIEQLIHTKAKLTRLFVRGLLYFADSWIFFATPVP